MRNWGRKRKLTKTQENAYALLPHLVKFAQLRELVTYEDLMAKIDMYAINASVILGFIRDEICIPRNLPLLTAIVINKNTKLPGDDWLPEGTSNLNEKEYTEKFRIHRNRVFRFDDWHSLLKKLNLEPIEYSEVQLHELAREFNNYLEQQQSPEIVNDKLEKLKLYVSENPKLINIKSNGPAEIDKKFITGDKVDILFPLESDEWAMVVVKDGKHPGELLRALYEIIKYNSLFKAEAGKGSNVTINNYLVADEIPKGIRDFAAKFYINCYPLSV
jgi:hypothetical protein